MVNLLGEESLIRRKSIDASHYWPQIFNNSKYFHYFSYFTFLKFLRSVQMMRPVRSVLWGALTLLVNRYVNSTD